MDTITQLERLFTEAAADSNFDCGLYLTKFFLISGVPYGDLLPRLLEIHAAHLTPAPAPAPSDPAPSDPAPTDPAPTEPAPEPSNP